MSPTPATDLDALAVHLTAVCERYEKTAPTVRDWADDLYFRIGETPDDVRLSEILTAARLRDADGWVPANLAADTVYKLQHRLGRPTTGHAGY